MPGAQKARDGAPRWEGGISAQELSLRDRINRPFQAIADRSNRQHRLNGGVTLPEPPAPAALKTPASGFAMMPAWLPPAAPLLSSFPVWVVPRVVTSVAW